MFRLLTADEIDVRVATINEKGCSLLLYKDARCDMNILDETVGAYNWMRSHSRDNANCVVSIWDDSKQQWISKEDTGTESFTEKEKGLASDSFKRACFNWGIGRELYTAPFIWIPSDKYKSEQKNGKWSTRDNFKVESIAYDVCNNIISLVIKNESSGKVCFEFPKSSLRKPANEAKIYTCSVCGAEIMPAISKGKQRSPKEIHEACGGMCVECYRKERNGSE